MRLLHLLFDPAGDSSHQVLPLTYGPSLGNCYVAPSNLYIHQSSLMLSFNFLHPSLWSFSCSDLSVIPAVLLYIGQISRIVKILVDLSLVTLILCWVISHTHGIMLISVSLYENSKTMNTLSVNSSFHENDKVWNVRYPSLIE